jgi:hypothetical protein
MVALFFLPSLSGDAQAPPVALTVTAAPSTAAIVLDGALNEPAWVEAGTIAGLTQQEPEPGRATPFDGTRISILSDSGTLYFGVTCPDPEPEKIAIHTLQRDADLEGDDTVALVLDTFGDGRTGYLFRINAGGARQDGLISGKEDVSLDWDGLWDARVRRTAEGWTAEIALSARSLRFRPGLAQWGFNVERYVARERRAGALTGVVALRQGLGLAAAPYALGRADDQRDLAGTRRKGEAGLDLSYNLTPGLGAVLTVNTNFAEIEVDTRQINLTRFPLFFPEKRPFFLEGSTSSRSAPVLRRTSSLSTPGAWDSSAAAWFRSTPVSSFSAAPVPGRSRPSTSKPARRPWPSRRTSSPGERPTTWTSICALARSPTRGDPAGRRDNALIGADAVWQTSDFRGDKNLSFGAWAARSDGDLAAGKRSGWGFKADYPNDLWDLFLVYREFGDALEPALGFLPRPGTRQAEGGGAFQPRPREDGSFAWVRQFFFELFLSQVDRLDGTTESWRVFTAPFNAVTRSGEHLEANWAPQFERLDEPFGVAAGVVIPPGEYQFTRWRVEGQSSSSRPWRVGSTVWFGDFFDGRLTQWESFIYWTFGPGRLRLELDAENNFGDLPQGNFIQRLWQLKTVYAASPDLVVSLFTQYDSESRDLGLNSRLRWTIQPGRDLFLVWNRNWQRTLDPGYRLKLDLDQVVVKLRWTTLW